jgi:hypothetical protein
VGCEQFFADVSSKIIALADPVLSQPDMKREMVAPPAGAYIPSFTIYHVLPDLPVPFMIAGTPYKYTVNNMPCRNINKQHRSIRCICRTTSVPFHLSR